MTLAARWIRLGRIASPELHAAYAGIAAAQAADAIPVVLWAQVTEPVCILHCAEPQAATAGTVILRRPRSGSLLQIDPEEFLFVLIVPLRHAPGRTSRWYSWALAPAAAAYRALGLPAHLQDHDIWLHGSRIAGCATATIGGCAVLAVGIPLPFADRDRLAGATGPSPEFDRWLRDGLLLARSEWTGQGAPTSERELETVIRERIAAQHGWTFENAWTTPAEQAAIAESRAALGEDAVSGAFEPTGRTVRRAPVDN